MFDSAPEVFNEIIIITLDITFITVPIQCAQMKPEHTTITDPVFGHPPPFGHFKFLAQFSSNLDIHHLVPFLNILHLLFK